MASYTTGATPLATTDAYGARNAVQLLCPGSHQVVLTVSTASIAAQLGYGIAAPNFEAAEHFLVPGVWPLSSRAGLDAVRVRSATPGKAATVAISAFA